MGVPGLWEILQPSARSTPLTVLALEAFQDAANGYPDAAGGDEDRGNDTIGKRKGRNIGALRIGIDASLWIFHAKTPQGGLNPFLRTMFFKVLKLIEKGVLPIFVFDGPNKPGFKRNNRVTGDFGRGDHASRSFKELLDMCGWCWWDAPGEAEAELAMMSREGSIDFVLTDDVDALLFGATKLLRNPSRTLTGANKSSLPVFETKETYQVYTISCIMEPQSEFATPGDNGEGKGVGLDTDGMIFIAICSGGDYHPAGIPNCGIRIAYALALAGFSTELLHSYRSLPRSTFLTYLPSFIDALKQELSTNSKGFLPNRRKALANSLPDTFPDLEVLEHYVRPAISGPGEKWPGFQDKGQKRSTRCGPGLRGGRGDPRGWARACEKWFEWGYGEEIGRKMRTLAWRGEIITGAMEIVTKDQRDEITVRRRGRSDSAAMTTPSTSSSSSCPPPLPFPPPCLIKIHSTREHPSTLYTPEYRIEYDPSEWTTTILSTIDGVRPNPNTMTEDERIALGMVPRSTASKDVLSSASEYEESSVDGDTDAPLRASRQRREVNLDSSDKVWIPAALIKAAYPDLVIEYEKVLAEKELNKTPKKGKVTSKSKGKTSQTDSQREKQQTLMSNWLAGANVSASQPTKGSSKALIPPRRPATSGSPPDVIDITDSPDPTPGPSSSVNVLLYSRAAKPAKRHSPPSGSSSVADEDEVIPRRLFEIQSTTKNSESVHPAPEPTEPPSLSRSRKPSPVKSPRTERRSYAGTLRSLSPTPTPKARAQAPCYEMPYKSPHKPQPKAPLPHLIIDLSGDDEVDDLATEDRFEDFSSEEEEEELLEPTPPRQRQARLERLSKSRSTSVETATKKRTTTATKETSTSGKVAAQSRIPFVAVRPPTISAVDKDSELNRMQNPGSSASLRQNATEEPLQPSTKTPTTPLLRKTKVKYNLVYEDDEEQRYERVVVRA